MEKLQNCELTEERAEELMSNWQNCFPIETGGLFMYASNQGIQKYDTYELGKECVQKIDLLYKIGSNGESNIKELSILLGMNKEEDRQLDTFYPILKIVTIIPFDDVYEFYFSLNPIPIPFSIFNEGNFSINNGQISVDIAELFISKWQLLENSELINAFNSISPENAITRELDGGISVSFGPQKMQRVKSYTFKTTEMDAIVEKINKYLSNGEEIEFFLHLGAGLTLPDFHPFNFRPIISLRNKTPVSFFFDTSRPCPPFCPDNISEI